MSFTFNRKLGRYRENATGRFINQKTVDFLTRQRIEQVKGDFKTVGELLLDGKINLRTWQETTARALRELHIQTYTLNRGGIHAMGNKDYLEVARSLKAQYDKLQGFAADLNRGYSIDKNGQRVPMTVGRFRARLNLYAQSGKIAASLGERTANREAGFTHMQRLLGAVDRHCADCLKYAAAGIVPIGTLPMPTEACACGNNCQCDVKWLKSAS